MDPGLVAMLGSQIIGGIASAQGAGQDYLINMQNLEWQKQQWKEVKKREDNAVRRRRKDLQAAGLNPVLAAGSAATTATAPHLPQISNNPGAVFGDAITKMGPQVMETMAVQAGIDKTQADTDYVKAQKEKTEAETDRMEKLTPLEVIEKHLSNAQSEAMNPLIIQRAKKELSMMDLEAEQKRLDNTIRILSIEERSLGLSQQQLEYERDQLRFHIEKETEKVNEIIRSWTVPDRVVAVAERAVEAAIRVATLDEIRSRIDTEEAYRGQLTGESRARQIEIEERTTDRINARSAQDRRKAREHDFFEMLKDYAENLDITKPGTWLGLGTDEDPSGGQIDFKFW